MQYILPSNQIRLSTAGNVNDPFENKMDWFDCDPATEPNGTNFDMLNQKDRIRNLLANHIKLLCCTKYNPLDTENFTAHYYAIPSMWSHYGDNHRGVCLIFDKNELNTNIKEIPVEGEIILDAVSYLPDFHFNGTNQVSGDRSQYPELIQDLTKLYDAVSEKFLKFDGRATS